MNQALIYKTKAGRIDGNSKINYVCNCVLWVRQRYKSWFSILHITILINHLSFRHVISDKKVLTSAITDGGTEETFGKEIITTKKTGEVIEIEFGGKTAKVVTKDIDAKNGVVHEIASIIGL